MTEDEYDQYRAVLGGPVIRYRDFMDLGPRVLMSGYDIDRKTVIVRHEPDSHTISLTVGNHVEYREEWAVHELYPDKRAYLEETDQRFAFLMREHGFPLAFRRNG